MGAHFLAMLSICSMLLQFGGKITTGCSVCFPSSYSPRCVQQWFFCSTFHRYRHLAGHRLRHELLESWAAAPLPGSQAGMESLARTEADMRSAVFCVCPPGAQSSGASRAWEATKLA